MREIWIAASAYTDIAKERGPEAALKALAGDVLSSGELRQRTDVNGEVKVSFPDISGGIVNTDRTLVTGFPLSGTGQTEGQAQRAFLGALLNPRRELTTFTPSQVRLIVGAGTRPRDEWTFVEVTP